MSAVLFSSRPGLAVLVSLVAAGLIALSGRSPNLREFWSLLAAVVKFTLVVSLLPPVLDGSIVVHDVLPIVPGADLSFRVDALALLFGLLASGLWVLTTLYSIGYMRTLGESKQTRYFASFALSLTAALGVAFAGNLLTLLIFYELLTIATYPLVIHKETPAAIAAGRKYLAYTLPAGLALLAATVWALELAGTVEFRPGGFLAGTAPDGTLIALFILAFLGFGVKAAVMPLQGWLPAAMVAPTPVSALLHAVAVVKAGVFAGLRLIGFVFGPELLSHLGLASPLAALAAVSILAASVIALTQDNLKLRLAYSTVGHLSYITLGATLFNPQAWAGAMFHIVNHAFMKITLFFCAGTIYAVTHKERVSELDGVGWRLPVTMGAFAVGALGLAGFPPVGGFLSKWFLGAGATTAGQPLLSWVLLGSGLLNAAYLLPVVLRAFFRRPAPAGGSGNDPADADEGRYWTMVLPLTITAVVAVLLGIAPDHIGGFWRLVGVATNQLFPEGGITP